MRLRRRADGLPHRRAPPRGEDSPLVRPYFVAYERRVAEQHAEARRRRIRGGVLLVAAHGLHLDRMAGGAA
ncbi:hypothetical protein H0E86_11565 [Streptomyces sp. SCSIO-PteL053]|nr:hypothetical protein H0E86_11565 [Streptomyces sp. SCSIO-PteL053]